MREIDLPRIRDFGGNFRGIFVVDPLAMTAFHARLLLVYQRSLIQEFSGYISSELAHSTRAIKEETDEAVQF